jgi:23S rRNA pseudouridine2605 synthase
MAFNNRKPQKQGAHGVARVISKRGYCSRSQAEKLVREGHVILRGKPVRDPETPAYENDEILVDGTPVTASEFVYFAMNKPRGIVTTASDEKGRKTVMDLFREEYAKMFPGKPMPHIAPVGRLDAASEGLLLFTNDTKWADALLKTKDDRRKTIESRSPNVILSPSTSSGQAPHRAKSKNPDPQSKLEDLEKQMKEAAARLDFEEAARLRDIIRSMK